MTYNYTLLTQNIYDGGNPVHSLGQVQISGGLNRLTGSQPSSLHNWISNDNIYEQAIKKPAQIHSHSKRLHSLTIMNDTINMRSTFKG
jgi:hypothetical protein